MDAVMSETKNASTLNSPAQHPRLAYGIETTLQAYGRVSTERQGRFWLI
jgi:hypothetical protein